MNHDVSPSVIYRIAADAEADPRSVRRVLGGAHLRVAAVDARIRKAAAAANVPVPTEPMAGRAGRRR